MRNARLWARMLGVERIGIVDAVWEEAGMFIATVRPSKGNRGRCGICLLRAPGYDHGGGRRRWRGLDAGTVMVFIEAEAPRVDCTVHGVVVAGVPWARHGAGHTIMFDDQITWLATHTSKTAVTELMRIGWRTVGAIIGRVVARERQRADPFDGLVRIGIDEISYKRGHSYLTVVVDHDNGADRHHGHNQVPEVDISRIGHGYLSTAEPSQQTCPLPHGPSPQLRSVRHPTSEPITLRSAPTNADPTTTSSSPSKQHQPASTKKAATTSKPPSKDSSSAPKHDAGPANRHSTGVQLRPGNSKSTPSSRRSQDRPGQTHVTRDGGQSVGDLAMASIGRTPPAEGTHRYAGNRDSPRIAKTDTCMSGYRPATEKWN